MNRALLVIDVQMVYFSGNLPITYPSGSLQNILRAMDKAKTVNIPIVVIQHSASAIASFERGSAQWQLHPEIIERNFALLMEKEKPGSFSGTPLEAWLKERGIDAITITGYMTQMCCDTTARQAFDLGFSVEFLSDATGTLGISNSAGSVTAGELHSATLVTQEMRFSKVLRTEEWITRV